jgi:hypothetical protein
MAVMKLAEAPGEAGLTEVQETYLRLLSVEPEARREWLLERQPAGSVRWWTSLIDSAVSDVRSQRRADPELVEFLAALGAEHGLPPKYAVRALAELVSLVGRPAPDDIALLALDHFGMSRDQAVARAAELHAQPDSQLLDIKAMLTDLAPFVDRMTGFVAVVVRAWLDVLPDL